MGAVREPALKIDFVQCEHCGRCLEVCPTYQASRTETLSARGRWDLISSVATGEMAPGARYYESLSKCLHCMACSATCPKGVDVEGMVRQARAAFPQDRLKTLLQRAVFEGVLINRPVMKTFIGVLAKVRRFFPARSDRLSRHLPLFLMDLLNGHAIPRIESRSIFQKFPERVPAATDVPRQGTIAYFPGCFNALVDPAPAEDAIRVLAHNGFDIMMPRDQTCCGAPLFFSGDREVTLAMMRKNIAALSSADRVLVSCATCGSMLRREYPEVAKAEGLERSSKDAGADEWDAAGEGGHCGHEHAIEMQAGQEGHTSACSTAGGDEADDIELYRQACSLASRTRDFVELLAGIEIRPGHIPIRRKVTIHDPCDLVRGQNISGEIRRVLSAIPGLEIIEMEHPARCCGGGGTFSISHPELAAAIGRQKIQDILDTGASMVVTACPGCILQIGRILAREGHPLPVVHPAELLAESYGFHKTQFP